MSNDQAAYTRHLRSRKIKELVAFSLFRLTAVIVIGSLGGIILFLFMQGISAINWTFLTDVPRNAMTQGGIFPAIVGTLLLTAGAMLVALPLGVASAIYLSEYATEGRILTIIRLGIQNLAGVPSVIFGLFGLALFCVFFKFGISVLSGSLTLGFLILPTVISASEEALRQVPATFREASLALGATRWQTIRKVVLPAALPGVLTGSILGVGRAAGETAPIMFTAATFYTLRLPGSPLDEVMALPFHIYVLATAGTHIEQTRPLQYGTVLVLITLVLGMCLSAIIIRARMRRKKRW
ncbi:MAG: phosphate ABC transporter permease PstA [Proteobacteria bacterium]|nr:phosphate ABC transporter permease PstA [Pseudomonadota bacterium]